MIKKYTFTYFAIFTISAIAPTAFSAESGPVARWTFDRAHIESQTVKDRVGASDASITGDVVFDPNVKPESMVIDRDETLVEMKYDPNSPSLPKKSLTAETWVRIEKTVEWGGILGAIQDNGNFQKGWLLGFRQSSFSFGLSSQGADDGDGRITYIRSSDSLEWGKWYHLVGTYDGETMKLFVDGVLKASSKAQNGDVNYPDKARFLAGAYMDDDDNFRWRGLMHEARIYDRALSDAEITNRYKETRAQYDLVFRPVLGPYLQRLTRDTMVLEWETVRPMPSTVVFGERIPLNRRFEDKTPKTKHKIVIDGIERDKLFYYRILGDRTASRLYEFDSTFDYTPVPAKFKGNPFPEDEWTPIYEDVARNILEKTGINQGYCLIVGSGEGRLAYELARQSRLQVVGIDEDADAVQRSRRSLDKAGLYGVRVTFQHHALDSLPYPSFFANLIVCDRVLTEGKLPASPSELFRVLRPCGGVMVLGQSEEAATRSRKKVSRDDLKQWLKSVEIPEEVQNVYDEGNWMAFERGRLPGSGDWTHMYADPANTACNNDIRLGLPLRTLWFGRPGPRPMMDRGTRPAAPVSINGRMFVQGDRRLFCIDAYNGTIYWTLEIPDLRRANIPRDCSNMAADEDRLYLAVRNACWVLDAATGDRVATYYVTGDRESDEYDWSYLARMGGLLLGSAARKGATYIGADGEWYDASGDESFKVTSDFFFALDPKTGEQKWRYRGEGPIVNPTIAAGDGRIFLMEGRSSGARKSPNGRLYKELMSDQYLVALDVSNGEKVMEKQVDVSEGRWVLTVSYSSETLLVLSTTDKYHLFAFNAKNGEKLWDQTYNWYRNNHGGAMQHPLIVRDLVFAEPKVFDLKTGKDTGIVMPERNKCGTIAAAAECLFYRDFWHGMWDLKSDKRIDWIGIRPGCWLNMVPSGGIVLAPEASAGCFCTHPMQTSIAFVPLKD